ncbi:unnamed protein product [Camellia sinensis]
MASPATLFITTLSPPSQYSVSSLQIQLFIISTHLWSDSDFIKSYIEYMERNSLSNNLKQHSIGGRSMKGNKSDKDSWEYYNSSSDSHGGGDLPSGFSWPPRSYTCSFCKREFRSAQALGGHMNVHRRDRARLRLSPPRDGQQYPFLNLDLNPNPPNPNSEPNPSQNPNDPAPSSQLSPPPSTRFPPITSTSLPSLSSPSSASPSEIRKWVMNNTPSHLFSNRVGDLAMIKSSKTLFGVTEFESTRQEKECEVVKEAEIVRLDLEIGFVSDSKEDLDLELRLGRP